jgi:phosphodiester glycosidase
MTAYRRAAVGLPAFVAILGIGTLAWLWFAHGAYGFGVLLRRGGSYWVTMAPDDPRLSPAIRVALRDPPPQVTAGAFVWNEAEPGFEIAQMPVVSGDAEIDRILLARIDPRRFRFVVHNAPAGDRDIDQWRRALPEAVLIVNGSYFDAKGLPDTPVIREGVADGPTDYDARGGALVDADGTARLIDLANKNWKVELAGARNATISYPMLIGADGHTRVAPESRWLSNRTFLGLDGAGRIVVGTTKEAFFSLSRLATFLKAAPLDLRLALNLDGGPIACRSLHLKGIEQTFYAEWESQFQDGRVSLLRSIFPVVSWAMPMVLAIERR